jgi:antitoxin component YwqK of YwqJK toxin-antitoxin module
MARARKLAIWNQTAESSVNQDGNIEWAEEKYASGKLRQREPVVAGRRHGMATYWFENGRVYGEIPWLNGEKHGSFNLYREDGSLEQSLSYRNGKPHGLLTWYDPQGNVKARALYDNGQVLSTDRKVLDALR